MKYPKYFPDVVGTRKSPLDSFIIAVSPLDLVLFLHIMLLTESKSQKRLRLEKKTDFLGPNFNPMVPPL